MFSNFFRAHVLPRLVWWLYWAWSKTWRVHYVWENPEQKDQTPVIFAHWHRDELAVLPQVKVLRLATMTSTSKDGQLIDFVIRKFGGATSKGSSTRGGVGALKGLIRFTRSGYNSSMAVDGPKGPIFQVKPGIFELSKACRAPIVPVGIASSSSLVFKKSWNKAQLPWPFARICIVFCPHLPFNEVDVKDPGNQKALGNAIANACESASKILRQ